MSKKKAKTILAIPDLHLPFEHPDTFKFLAEIKKQFKPEVVIQLGDLIDSHTLSRWGTEIDAPSSADEHEIATERIDDLGKIFQQVTVITGNHDLRAYKRMLDVGIPSIFMKTLKAALNLPKLWSVVESVTMAGIHFFHGDGFTGKDAALKAALAFRMSVVMGHVHSFAGIQYSNSPSGQIFGANAGCLIDVKSLAFNYAKAYPHKPVLGVLVIEGGIPQFIPMGGK